MAVVQSFEIVCISLAMLILWPEGSHSERFNYCPRTCIRGVQQFPFSEICICPEYCPVFCCAGYYYHSPINGACPNACGAKSRPLRTECCLPGGFSDPVCIIGQKRWFDANNRGVWWWPAVFNDTSVGSQYQSGIRGYPAARTNLSSYSLVKAGQRKNPIKAHVSNAIHETDSSKLSVHKV